MLEVEKISVLIVVGETGSGKSTRMPTAFAFHDLTH
jgi:HrpA-like RNA helicase